MSDEQEIKLYLGSMSIFAPLIAAQLTAAFYSALLLKKQSGVEITAPVEDQTRREVLRHWNERMEMLSAVLEKLPPPAPPKTPRGQ